MRLAQRGKIQCLQRVCPFCLANLGGEMRFAQRGEIRCCVQSLNSCFFTCRRQSVMTGSKNNGS